MVSEILLPVIQAVLPLALTGVGIEMANRPPRDGAEGRTTRITYRTTFAVLGIVSFVLTIVQMVNRADERKKEQAAAHDLALKNESDMRTVKSGLATINAIVSHLPTGINSNQLAAIVQHVVKESLPRE